MHNFKPLSALLLFEITAACAPAGYHYGSWADGPTAAFTVSPNAPPQGFTEGNGQPLTPTRNESPISTAITKYCATAAPLACSLYTGKVTKCQNVAANAYSILVYERAMRMRGATPRQATEMAVRTTAQSPFPLHPEDLGYIAERAQDVPSTKPPELFQAAILKECIDAANE